MMGDDKSARSLSPMGGRDRDLELLIPVSGGSGSGSGGSPSGDDDVDRTASSSASAALSSSGREVRLPTPRSPRVFSAIQLQFWLCISADFKFTVRFMLVSPWKITAYNKILLNCEKIGSG
jgi:hypothetical protein